MLGNLVIGPEKFVLFIDKNTYEPVAQKLLHRLLNGSPIYHCPKIADLALTVSRRSIDIDEETNAIPSTSNVILANISKLEMNYSIRDIVHLVDKLKKSPRVKQCFGWIAAKQIRNEKIIMPFLEYMADIVVTLQDEHTLNVLTKRSTGSVFKKEYQYEIKDNFDIYIKEKPKSTKKAAISEPAVDPSSLATFKIDVNDDEEEARSSLKLPYERNASTEPKTSQIFYQPDADDDFDDEDPDEDLNI